MTDPSPTLLVDWATHQATVYACEHWHYSKTVPVPPLVKIGVWECGRFIGVVIFSRGASSNLLKPYGLKQTEGCELTRVALDQHRAPVTRIIRLALVFLRSNSPGMRLIVSFADPHHGHIGGIYQAGNWIYCGLTPPGREYWQGEKRWHSRQVSPSGQNIQQGTVRRTVKPDECEIVVTPGKYRYLLPLDAAMARKIEPLRQPYPKRLKQATGATSVPAAGQNRPNRSTTDRGTLNHEGTQAQTHVSEADRRKPRSSAAQS